MSGTFEALLYDELAVHRATDRYAGVVGLAHTGSVVAALVATAVAAPLMWVGGYSFVGWLSVAGALVQAGIALSLPAAPAVVSADETGAGERSTERALSRYFAGLRAGLAEAARFPTVRRAVLLSGLIFGSLATDEYLPFVAQETGTSAARIPLLLALAMAGEAIGTALAGRSARWSRPQLALALFTGAVLLAIGVLSRHPTGFIAIAVGYAAASNVNIVAGARLQNAIRTSARATVTSASGFLAEVIAVLVFAVFALGSPRFGASALVALLCIPLVGAAVLLPGWLPERRWDLDDT